MVDLVGRGKSKSASDAKDRLRLVLIHDRTDISPDLLDALKNDILGVISKYIDIDASSVRITIPHEGREQRLIADIPLKPSHRRRIG